MQNKWGKTVFIGRQVTPTIMQQVGRLHCVMCTYSRLISSSAESPPPLVRQACLIGHNWWRKPRSACVCCRAYCHNNFNDSDEVLFTLYSAWIRPNPLREYGECRCSGRLEFTGVGSASRNRTAAPAFFLLPSQNKQQGKVIFPLCSD